MLSQLSKGYGSWEGELGLTEKPSKDFCLPALPIADHKHGVTVSPRIKTATSSHRLQSANGELVLPKTFLTRHGALLLFTAPEEILFNKLRKRISKSEKIDELKKKFSSLDRLAASVLQYGDKEDYDPDISISDPRNQCVLHFLHGLDEKPIDMHAQPGGDFDFYLSDIKSRTSSRSRAQSAVQLSQIHTDEDKDQQKAMESVESYLQPLRDDEERSNDSADQQKVERPRSGVSYFNPTVTVTASREGSATLIRRQPHTQLRADSLTANLKSTSYLGRPTPPPLYRDDDKPKSRHSTASSISHVHLSRPPSESSAHSDVVSTKIPSDHQPTAIQTQKEEVIRSSRVSSAHSNVSSIRHAKPGSANFHKICATGSVNSRKMSAGSVTKSVGHSSAPPNSRSNSAHDHNFENLEVIDRYVDIEDDEFTIKAEVKIDRILSSPAVPSLKSAKSANSNHRGVDKRVLSLSNVDAHSVTELVHETFNLQSEEIQPKSLPESFVEEWIEQTEEHLDMEQPRSIALSLEISNQLNDIADDQSAHSNIQHPPYQSALSLASGSFSLDQTHPDSQQMGELLIDDAVNQVIPHTVQSVASRKSSATRSRVDSGKTNQSSVTQQDEAQVMQNNEINGGQDSVKSGGSNRTRKSDSAVDKISGSRSADSRRTITQEIQVEPFEIGVNYAEEIPSWGAESQQEIVDDAPVGSQSLLQPPYSPPVPPATADSESTSTPADKLMPSSKAISPERMALEHSDIRVQLPPSVSTKDLQETQPITMDGDWNKDIRVAAEHQALKPPVSKPAMTKVQSPPNSSAPEKTAPAKKLPVAKTSTKVSTIKKNVPKLDISSVNTEKVETAPAEDRFKALDSNNLIADTKAEIKKIFGDMPKPVQSVKKDEKPSTTRPKKVQIKAKPKEEPPPELKVPVEVKNVMEKSVTNAYGGGMSLEELEIEQELLKQKIEEAHSQLDMANPIPKKKGGKKGVEKKDKRVIKKTPEILEAEKEAIRERKRLEKEKREEEAKQLQEMIAAKEIDKQIKAEEQRRKQKELQENLLRIKEQEEEARMAEEEARQALLTNKKAAREEREKKRREEMERKRQEAIERRESERRLQEAARAKELEMLERIADAESVRKQREEERRRREEEDLIDNAKLEDELHLAQLQAEAEEEKFNELEQQVEEEAMAQLVKEREEAERLKLLMEEEAERIRQEEEIENQRLVEEQRRLEEEMRIRQEEEEKRQEIERQRLMELQKLEEEARERMRQEMQRRRQELLARREVNVERRNNLEGMKRGQGMTKSWIFSYYLLWPRETYERLIGGDDKKKKGFRPKPKKK